MGAANPGSPSHLRQATGQPYGQNKQLADAVAAVPAGPPQSTAGSRSAAALEAARNYRPPQVGLGAPTARPGEPITAGLGSPVTAPGPTGPDPDVIAMAKYLPMLETLASRPNASTTTRAFVRRLRSMLPPDFEFGA